jgi:hypothetical protein
MQEDSLAANAHLPNSISPSKMSQPFSILKEEVAAFAEGQLADAILTSNTTMRPEQFEGSSVDDATRALACLEIVQKLLSEHAPTCAIHQRLGFFVEKGQLMLQDRKPHWMKGIPLSHFTDSLNRHLLQWAENDVSEDHAGAIIWNACCAIWTDEEIKAGRLPKELDDLPYRRRESGWKS